MRIVQKLKRERLFLKTFGPGYVTSRRRAGPGVMSARTRFGDVYFRPGQSDLLTFWQTLGAREYDLARFPQYITVRKRYEEALAAGLTPVILDAGANVGAASVWFANQFPAAQIIAVEPDPANAELCRKNTRGRNVRVVEAAIGATPGAVSLQPADEAWGTQTVRGGNIPIVTVVDLLAAIPQSAFLIAKVDIEGFEADLFGARTEWLQQVTALIIEPHDWMLPGAGSSRSFRSAIGPEFDLLISGENLIFVRADPAEASVTGSTHSEKVAAP